MHEPDRKHPDCSNCGTLARCIARDLGSSDLGRFARQVRSAHVWPGTDSVVFDHDDPFDCVYAVRKGCVKTYVVDVTGQEHVLGFRWPGELFGLEGVMRGRYPYSARALMPSEVCVFDYDGVREAMHQFPEVARNVFTRTLHEAALNQTRDGRRPARRLAAFLLEVSGRIRMADRLNGVVARLPMRWSEVASYLHMTPRMLHGLLSRFEQRRLVLARGQEFILLDRERLAGMLEEGSPAQPDMPELAASAF